MKALHGLMGVVAMLAACGKPSVNEGQPAGNESVESNAPAPQIGDLKPVAPQSPQTPAPLAGLYRGEVGGKMSQLRVNADGTLMLHPRLDQPDRKAPGTWKREGEIIAATFNLPDGKGQAWLRLSGDALVMDKLQTPDGEIEEFAPSRFKRTATVAGRKHAGTYEGSIDQDDVKVQLNPDGQVVISSLANGGTPLYQGTWKNTPDGVEITVGDKDDKAKAHLQVDGDDLLLYKLEQADGDVENLQPRLERVTEK